MTKEINAICATEKNIPMVLTRDEVRQIVDIMEGVPQLIVRLRAEVMGAVRLRSQDIDYQMLQISIRSGKGGKERFWH